MIRIVCAAREQEKKRERPGTYSLRFSNRDRHVVVVTEEREGRETDKNLKHTLSSLYFTLICGWPQFSR